MSIWKDNTNSVPFMRFGELQDGKNFVLHSAATRRNHDAAVMIKLSHTRAMYINGNTTGSGDRMDATTKIVPVTLTSVEYERNEKMV